jgi:succinate dehydrogenase / fumarate reductase cytochrome b subunit
MKSHFLRTVSGSLVFRKFVMGATGLALVGFTITHLSANLLLYKKDGELFNAYAEKLASFGVLLYVAEAALLAFFLFHAFTGIRLALIGRKAKPVGYEVKRSKGGNSRSGIASNSMAITGSVLLVFLVLHVIHFKFGPGIGEGYTAQVGGVEARDLHRLVYEEFKKPGVVAFYVVVMAILATHLRHGVWSALQSLGLTKTNTKTSYLVLGLIGVLLGVGFLTIPVFVYFFG